MSEIFEGYERQYCELSENLSRKCTSVLAFVGGHEQRTRLLMSTEKLNQSSEKIKESKWTLVGTEKLGVSSLQDLDSQRQTLLHAHNNLQGVDDNIGKSWEILNTMG